MEETSLRKAKTGLPEVYGAKEAEYYATKGGEETTDRGEGSGDAAARGLLNFSFNLLYSFRILSETDFLKVIKFIL